MQTCPRCSAENKDGVAACWNCAAPLEGGPAQPAEVEDLAVRRSLPWKPILAILAIVVLAFVVYRLVGGMGPVDVAKVYLDAKYNGMPTRAEQVTARDTVGSPLLPTLLLVGSSEVTGAPQSMGDQTVVPANVAFRLDVSLKDAKLAAAAAAAEKSLRQPMATQIVVVKRTGKWKVDQTATSLKFREDALRRYQGDQAWIGDLFKGAPLPLEPGVAPPPSPAPSSTLRPPQRDDDDDDDDDEDDDEDDDD